MLLLDISLLQELYFFGTSLYNQTYMDTIKKRIVQLAHLNEKTLFSRSKQRKGKQML